MAAPGQLGNAWLAEVDFRVHADWASQEQLWFRPREQFEVSLISPFVDDAVGEYGLARAELAIQIEWFLDPELDASAESWPFDLSIRVDGDFTFMGTDDEQYIRTWLDYNGAYLLWPYARAYISSITSLGKFAKLMLETREILDVPDVESQEDVRPSRR